MYKLMVTVPVAQADALRRAMGDAGAGVQGAYTHCSFSVRGIGRFVPQAGANPFVGTVGVPEAVEEEQIQVTVADDKVPAVLAAMRAAHPYEEVAYELWRIEERP